MARACWSQPFGEEHDVEHRLVADGELVIAGDHSPVALSTATTTRRGSTSWPGSPVTATGESRATTPAARHGSGLTGQWNREPSVTGSSPPHAARRGAQRPRGRPRRRPDIRSRGPQPALSGLGPNRHRPRGSHGMGLLGPLADDAGAAVIMAFMATARTRCRAVWQDRQLTSCRRARQAAPANTRPLTTGVPQLVTGWTRNPAHPVSGPVAMRRP